MGPKAYCIFHKKIIILDTGEKMIFVNLIEVATVHSGYFYKKGSQFGKDLSICIIQPKNIFTETFINLEKIPVKSSKNITFLIDGDVLLTSRGYFKAMSFWEGNNKAIAALGIFIIRIKNPQKLLPDFLAFWLNSVAGQSALEQIQLFTTTKSINKEDLLNIKIPIPTIETQQHYALLYKNYIKQKGLFEQLSDLNLKVINKISISLQEQK